MQNGDAFYLYADMKDGFVQDLGAVPGQAEFYKKVLDNAMSFTREHDGTKALNTDVLEVLKDKPLIEALLGAYYLGFETGYEHSKK